MNSVCLSHVGLFINQRWEILFVKFRQTYYLLESSLNVLFNLLLIVFGTLRDIIHCHFDSSIDIVEWAIDFLANSYNFLIV